MQAESPPTDTRRRLYREPADKKLAGVCAGLADYLGIDVRLIRLGVIVLALSNGVGIVGYVIAAIIVPERPGNVPRRQSPAEPLSPTVSNALIVGLVLLVVLTVGDGHFWWLNGPTLGLLLVGFGIWLLVSEREKSPEMTTPGAGGTTLPGEAASQSDLSGPGDGTTVPLSEPDDSTGPRGEVPPPVPPWGPTNLLAPPPPAGPAPTIAAPPRPRDPGATAAFLGAVCVVGGVLTCLVVFGALDLSAGEWAGAALLAVGIGMIVGAWMGRGRILAAVGLPMLLVLMSGEAIDVPLSAGAGDRQLDVNTLAELRAFDRKHEMFAGDLRIDLSDAPLGQPGVPTQDLTVNVGIGDMEIDLPPDVTAEIEADVDMGDFTIGEQSDSGLDVHRSLVLQGTEGGGRIRLHLHMGLGEIQVFRG